MADRTVSTRLRLDVGPFSAGARTAGKDLATLNRNMMSTAGFADGMRKKLEDATKRLPKIEIDADSSPAQIKFAQIRHELEKLSEQTIGVDIDAGSALAEMDRLRGELLLLEDGASFEVRAGIQQATEDLAAVNAEVRRLDGRHAKVRVDVDTDSAMPKLASFGDAAGGALATALRSSATPALLGALGGLAASVGPVIGAAMGGAIVAGIGARLTFLGGQSLFFVQEIDKSWSAVEKKRVEEANKQANRLRSQFKELGRDLALAMQESSRPLLSVLDEARVQARGLAKDIGPDMAAGFDQVRVPLERFIRDAGAGLKELGDAIPSLMDGFGDVLDGIDIKRFLSDLGDAFDDLGRAVSNNRSTIGSVLNGLLDVIPIAVAGLGKVVDFFGVLGSAVMNSAATISEHMAGVTSVITGVGRGVLDVVRTIGQTLANVPGMEDLGKKIVAGADAGIRKLQEFQKTADEASRSVRLKADIHDLQQQIDRALTLLDDPNLSKERRAQIGAEIQRLLIAQGRAIQALGDPALVAEYKSQLTTDISTLQSRLADARKELKDPELTKERKSRLNAEIGQLEAGVKRAKNVLETLHDKTVTVFVKTEYQDSLSRQALRDANKRAAGGIDRYAAGGILRAAEGMRLRPQPPQLVSRPTVLFGEGSSGTGATEAFIPYEPRYRQRATELLGQVADDFGLELYSKRAAERVSDAGITINATGMQVAGGLQAAVGVMTGALGEAGSLTSAISRVGSVGGALSDAWTGSVYELTQTMAAIGKSGSVGASAKKSMGSLGKSKPGAVGASASKSMGSLKGKSKSGSVGASAKKSMGSLKGGMVAGSQPGGMVGGSQPLDGSFVYSGASALSMGAPVNSSKVSAPQQAYGGGGGGSYGGGAGAAGMLKVSEQLATVVDRINRMEKRTPVVVQNMQVREQADVDVVSAKLAFSLLSRG